MADVLELETLVLMIPCFLFTGAENIYICTYLHTHLHMYIFMFHVPPLVFTFHCAATSPNPESNRAKASKTGRGARRTIHHAPSGLDAPHGHRCQSDAPKRHRQPMRCSPSAACNVIHHEGVAGRCTLAGSEHDYAT